MTVPQTSRRRSPTSLPSSLASPSLIAKLSGRVAEIGFVLPKADFGCQFHLMLARLVERDRLIAGDRPSLTLLAYSTSFRRLVAPTHDLGSCITPYSSPHATRRESPAAHIAGRGWPSHGAGQRTSRLSGPQQLSPTPPSSCIPSACSRNSRSDLMKMNSRMARLRRGCAPSITF